GTHGSRTNVSTGRFDHFACGSADESEEIANIRIVRLVESYLEGVAIERAQTFDGSIEVELAAGARRVDNRSGADDEVGEDRRAAAPAVRVQPPLVRVDVIVSSELARLAFECGIVGELDALRQADRPQFS